MTKYKTTDKEQKRNNSIVIGFGYCKIQNLERYFCPNAYTSGIYGWRANFYEFGGFTISTGYSPLEFFYKDGGFNEKIGLLIKREILKLEKRLEKKAYKGDFFQVKAKIEKKLASIYGKAVGQVYGEQ